MSFPEIIFPLLISGVNNEIIYINLSFILAHMEPSWRSTDCDFWLNESLLVSNFGYAILNMNPGW